ncbi:MAG: helix-turn-helix domain-containing protein [Pyrinomonadaceae bacterium]
MDRRIELIIETMEADVTPVWDTRYFAELVNLSPSRLRHLFKEETGQSVRQYLKRLKLKQAEVLLHDTFLSVKEIASAIGFGSVSHFVREFKREFTLAPNHYRRAWRRTSQRPKA